jgi:hypothetical protein
MAAKDIVLGKGVFSIGEVDIGLTRGGGRFTIERTYRRQQADGDKGPVKGRVTIDESIAKLNLKALELLPANIPKLYPATKVATATGTDTITAKSDIEDTDYNTVTWTGRTKEGRPVKITLENAINLENIDWPLVDKDEIIAEITYTATYTDDARDAEPWKIEYLQKQGA